MQRVMVAVMVLLVVAVAVFGWLAYDSHRKLSDTQTRLRAAELRLNDTVRKIDLARAQQDIDDLRSCVNGAIQAITLTQPRVQGQC